MRFKAMAFAAIAVAAAGLGSSCSLFDGAGETDFQRMVKGAKQGIYPAVVFVKVVTDVYVEGERKSQEAAGSGVLISPDGKLLTNWHVINKATKIRCLLYNGDAYEAELLGSDKDVDLALLKLKAPEAKRPFPFAELGDSSLLKEGDFVMALGAPWGLTRSVSVGIVSCSRRYVANYGDYTLLIQTDASISPGNSGGPMVSMDGKVVGINSLGSLLGGNLGMAIPSNTIADLIGQLERNGRIQWSWTGISLQPLKDFNKDVYSDASEGVIVEGIEAESPAMKAGLKPKDRIVSINGKTATAISEEDLPDIKRALGLLPMNVPAKISAVRDGKPMDFEIVPREKGKVEGQELACQRWDISAKAINQFDSPNLYFQKKSGAYVFGLKYPGNAMNAGLRRNDIILKANGREIDSLEDLKAVHKDSLEAFKLKKPGSGKILFELLRGGSPVQAVVDISQDFDN